MGSLLVVTGPPGAGKSTLAEALAARMEPSVLIEGDAFFRFLRNGGADPWLPEADGQNAIVTRAAGAAAGAFATGNMSAVYDGVVGSWFVEEFMVSTGLSSLDYVVLLPPVEVCVERVLTRRDHGFRDEAAARHMHDEFSRRPPADRHVLRHAHQPPEQLADVVLDARHRGGLRYPVS